MVLGSETCEDDCNEYTSAQYLGLADEFTGNWRVTDGLDFEAYIVCQGNSYEAGPPQ
jgi:hypothetical protein